MILALVVLEKNIRNVMEAPNQNSNKNQGNGEEEVLKNPARRLFVSGAAATIADLFFPKTVNAESGRVTTTKKPSNPSKIEPTSKETKKTTLDIEQEIQEVKNLIRVESGPEIISSGQEITSHDSVGRKITLDELENKAQLLEVLKKLRAYLLMYPPDMVSKKILNITVGVNLKLIDKTFFSTREIRLAGNSDETVSFYLDVSPYVSPYVSKVDPNFSEPLDFHTLVAHELGHNFFPQEKYTKKKWVDLVTEKLNKIEHPNKLTLLSQIYDSKSWPPQYTGDISQFGNDGNVPRPLGYVRNYSRLSHVEDKSTLMELLFDPVTAKYLEENLNTGEFYSDLLLRAKVEAMKEMLNGELSMPHDYWKGFKDRTEFTKAGNLDAGKTSTNWLKYWKKFK